MPEPAKSVDQPRKPIPLCSYDRSRVGANELAGLLAHVACFAPGQSFHLEADAAVVNIAGCSAAASGSSSDGGSSSSDGLPTSRQRPPRLQPALLHGALARSLVCVAAFAEEQSLPPEALASLAQLQQPQQTLQQQVQQEQQQQGSSSSSSSSSSWRVSTRRSRPRRVLVGFARAVGDAALVATVHDVAVLPALQGLGLGQQLVERLTRQVGGGRRRRAGRLGIVRPCCTAGCQPASAISCPVGLSITADASHHPL